MTEGREGEQRRGEESRRVCQYRRGSDKTDETSGAGDPHDFTRFRSSSRGNSFSLAAAAFCGADN
ncbi:hypothetical protein DAI22_07g007000 [Oryza sativa Japonica Group]|nr:hypothetical protein DAI22_07g007000 [Oryza sativa Japonica Group]